MRRGLPALIACLVALAAPAAASATSGVFESAWGLAVEEAGSEFFDVCAVPANCRQAASGAVGGSMSHPEGVAVAPDGTVFVADTSQQRVQKFSAGGQFMRTWGKDVNAEGGPGTGEICTIAENCQAGSSATAFGGEFDHPTDVAVDSLGNVYVIETNNNRVQKFDSDGDFLLAWGKDVSTAAGTGFETCSEASQCQEGSLATARGGELNNPHGIAVGPGDVVYVADSGNHRIQAFTASGEFLAAWGKNVSESGGAGHAEVCVTASDCKQGEAGGQGGEFSRPEGVTATSEGVLVADTENQRIQYLNASGEFIRAWGGDVDSSGGSGAGEVCVVAANCKQGVIGGLSGEFEYPNDAGVDGHGFVYVTDTNHHRVEKFELSGAFLSTWGADVVSGGETGFEVCTTAADCKAGLHGGLGGEMYFPFRLDVTANGRLYVADATNNRVQVFAADPVVEPPVEEGTGGGGSGSSQSPSPGPIGTVPRVFKILGLSGSKLKVRISPSGKVTVADARRPPRRQLKRSSVAGGPGIVKVPLKLKPAARRLLAEQGRLRVKVKVTFVPATGAPAVKSKALVLRG